MFMNISSIFKKQDREHHDEYVYTEEDYVFQHNFKRYYVRKIYGAVELWARDVRDENMNFYLGKVVDDRILLTKAFYTFPYDVQKATGRLCRIYLHNDHREL